MKGFKGLFLLFVFFQGIFLLFLIPTWQSPDEIHHSGYGILLSENMKISPEDYENLEKKIIESNSIAGGIAKASKEFDLVVIGAAKEPLFKKILFGEIPEKVARYSPTSVIVVKKYEGVVKSTFKKVMG